MSTIPMPLAEHEIARALEIAREMARAGVPIFVAAPAPGTKVGYALPPSWETTTADPAAVDQWRPGWALCAVGGHVCDFLDVDPRNGGADSLAELEGISLWPRSYGMAFTPSGGTHELVQPLGVGKGELVAGVDLQGGRPDGSGRGFVFIAPTVRASKVDGVARAYRWDVEPKLAELAAQRPWDTSGAGLAKLLPVKRSKINRLETAKPGSFDALLAEPEWSHTVAQADRAIAAKSAEVTNHIRTRGWSGFRDVLNGAAYTLGAYVGSGYMTGEQAFAVLESAIRLAGYPINDESTHTVEVGLTDGAAAPIRVVAQSSPLGRTVERGDFGAQLIDAADLDAMADPDPLVAGWLYQDTTARLVGQPGSYKSFVALDMALCVALGRPWHGRAVTQAPVLYVVGEGLADYKRRVRAWCEHNGVAQAELRGKLLLTRGSVQIGSPEWLALGAWVADSKVKFIIIDTQAKATAGYDENSNTDQAQVFAHLDAVRQLTGGTLLLVHHTGHPNGEAGERGRGASAWRASVDTELLLRKTGERSAALRNDRQKSAESGQEIGVSMVASAGSLAVEITNETPLSPRSQWLADQVAAGVRFDSAIKLCGALRDAGHRASNTDKAAVFAEYHRLIAPSGSPFDAAVFGEQPKSPFEA